MVSKWYPTEQGSISSADHGLWGVKCENFILEKACWQEELRKALWGIWVLNLAIRCLVMYTVSRVLLKGDATSGRIEDREFDSCKEKWISYVKSVKMMGSYVGLIICTVYFSETKQHDIVHKAFFFGLGQLWPGGL